MKNLALIVLVFLVFAGCASNEGYEYVPLNSFKNDTSLIRNGCPVRLLAFSGGKENDQENVYYYQVLVLNKQSGDTINVLCPSFRIPNIKEPANKLYISPLELNPARKISDATFEHADSSLNFLLQVMGDVSGDEPETASVTKYTDKMYKHEVVAVNHSLSVFNQKFKTIVGILAFDTDPR